MYPKTLTWSGGRARCTRCRPLTAWFFRPSFQPLIPWQFWPSFKKLASIKICTSSSSVNPCLTVRILTIQLSSFLLHAKGLSGITQKRGISFFVSTCFVCYLVVVTPFWMEARKSLISLARPVTMMKRRCHSQVRSTQTMRA